MTIDRTQFSALVDDDGSGHFGSRWNKAAIQAVLLDPIDAMARKSTWLPVIGGAGGTSGQTYSAQEGYYFRYDELVLLWFRAVLSAKGTITGGLQIQGFPFTIRAGITTLPGLIHFNALNTNWISLNLGLNSGAVVADVLGINAAGTSDVGTQLVTGDVTNTTALRGFMAYRTSSP